MITYTVDKGQYITMEESLKRHPEGKRGMYVNQIAVPVPVPFVCGA